MNLRKFRFALLLYVAFDFFFGGICGGFFQLTPLAAAQFTTVSGTVMDPNGLPYANGTITSTLVISSSPKFTSTNQPYTPPAQPVGLSTTGSFVMQLADVTALTPGGGTYSFTVSCAVGCVPIAGGKGPVAFTVTGVTVSGVSQNISATLNASALALTVTSSAGCPQGTCVVNAPSVDQTITGAHGLLLSDPGGNIWVKSTASGGGLAVGSGAPGNNGFSGIDIRILDTWVGAVAGNSFRGINDDVTYNPSVQALGANIWGEFINLNTGANSTSNLTAMTGLDVFAGSSASAVSSAVKGIHLISGIASGGGTCVQCFGIDIGTDTAGTGTVGTMDSLHITGTGAQSATSTVTNNRGIYIGLPLVTGTLTHNYGLFVDDQSGGGANNPDSHSIHQIGNAPNEFQAHVNQIASGNWAGTCTFAAGTTCVCTYASTTAACPTSAIAYTSTPVVILQPINPGAVTFTLTSTSNTGFTITGSAVNSLVVNWVAYGNPN